MSDNEYERFEITDYDLANEFNPNRRRRQTKHQAIYGIWADEDSENDSNDDGARRGRHTGKREPMDYSAPVNFVAGGVQQAGKKRKAQATEKPIMQSDSESDDSDDNAAQPRGAITDEDEDDNDDDGVPVQRTRFGQKPQRAEVCEAAPQSSDESSESEVETLRRPPPRADFVHRSHLQSGERNMGAWEQHTRGIGTKLLRMMGYEDGKGLGKDLQGIAQPVQAHVRKGRGAIGAYGPEKKTTHAAEPKIADEALPMTTSREQASLKWKKGEQKKATRKYQSVEEVIAKGKQRHTQPLSETLSRQLANVTVIDMTRPERRVLQGYKSLAQKQAHEEDIFAPDDLPAAFELPELTHNLQLLVDLCEQDIIAIDKAEREAINREEELSEEHENLVELVQLERAHMDTLSSVLKLVEELSAEQSNLTLARAEQVLLDLQQNYAAEYKEFGLGDLAAGVIAPLVRAALSDWKPLETPSAHIELFKRWREILQNDDEERNDKRGTLFEPYATLVWSGVMPSFRTCAEQWDPKLQHQQMAALLDVWAPLLPECVLDAVLEQLVLTRLAAAVQDWQPHNDVVPIHDWVLPWHGILAAKLEQLVYPVIRQKQANALVSWLPNDRSARAMITPWRAAYSERDMHSFLAENILPKLKMTLHELAINPAQQDLEPWYQVWEWHELLPSCLMAEMLDKCFFPRWMQVLIIWLNQTPDYEELSRWYLGWKSLIGEQVLREPSVKLHMERALRVMQHAIQLAADNAVPLPVPMPQIPTVQPIPPPPPATPQLQQAQQQARLIDMQLNNVARNFRETLMQKCTERGILFVPIPGRLEANKQIYRVGTLLCYIDHKVCMVNDGTPGKWTPISIQQLLERV